MFDYPIDDFFGDGQEDDDLRIGNALIVTIRMNLAYAVVSLKSILTQSGFDPKLYQNKYIFYFFHLQSLLTACGNISSACHARFAGMCQGRYDRCFYEFNIIDGNTPEWIVKEILKTPHLRTLDL